MAQKEKRKSVLDLGTANPKQALFYNSRALYTAYGGAKGGGRRTPCASRLSAGRFAAGIRILIVRRTYPELQQNHIEPVLGSCRRGGGLQRDKPRFDIYKRLGHPVRALLAGPASGSTRGRSTTGFSSTRPRSLPSRSFACWAGA